MIRVRPFPPGEVLEATLAIKVPCAIPGDHLCPQLSQVSEPFWGGQNGTGQLREQEHVVPVTQCGAELAC